MPSSASGSVDSEPVHWWAGIATVLPRVSLVPPRGARWLRRWKELQLDLGRREIFSYPDLPPAEARKLAKPTSSGLGDLICGWMVPMTLAVLQGWSVRIPVPAEAGGLHHDPARTPLTPEWLHDELQLPKGVSLIQAEAAPDGAEWFCTLEQQWHLNSCMETSYDTVPRWVRGELSRGAYYDAYRRVASRLLRTVSSPFGDGRPYFALHARRGDRGPPDDDSSVSELVSAAVARCRDWVVVSDDDGTAAALRDQLQQAGCTVAELPDTAPDERTGAIRDLTTLVGARAVSSSVRGGWSAFPYAATRVSNAPLLFTEPLKRSITWRVIRGHSRVPVEGVHHGPEGLGSFLASASI